MSFNPSIHLLEPYFTLKSALSILKRSLVKVVTPSSVEIFAGIVMLFVTSLIVKLPVTAIFASTSNTEVITNVDVGYAAISKKSGAFKCPSIFPAPSLPAMSKFFIVLMSITNSPSFKTPFSTTKPPLFKATVPLCAPVGFVPFQVIIEVVRSTLVTMAVFSTVTSSLTTTFSFFSPLHETKIVDKATRAIKTFFIFIIC